MAGSTTPQISDEFSGEVESVRGIAAFFVAFGHTFSMTLTVSYGGLLSIPTSFKALIQEILNLRISELTAVVVFFVISGFVLGRSLDRHLNTSSASGYLEFIWRRACRIYPAHIFALLAIIVVMTYVAALPDINTAHYPHLNDFYKNLLNGALYQSINLGDLFNQIFLIHQTHYNLVIWSLHVEIMMSLLLPILYVIARKERNSFDALILLLFVSWSIYRNPNYADSFYFAIYVPAFYAGLLVENWGKIWAEFAVKYLRHVEPVFLLSYLLILLPQWIFTDRSSITAQLEVLGTFSVISLLVWGPPCGIKRFLNHKLMRWNGRLSYSFYLWHWTIMLLSCRVGYAALPPSFIYESNELFFILMFGISLALSLGIAQLSYSLIELPFMRWGKYTIKKRKHGALRRKKPEIPH